ncbi:MAG: GNAT family N-acetyltransferase [Deltaproteobacteria bacterium]|nr:GNAT family N-acetyltransferase [Deltaproteobacteria bacterium]
MSDVDVELREAVQEDARALAGLVAALGYPSVEAQVSRRLSAVLRREDHLAFVAVDDGGGVIGLIHACELYRIESDRMIEIAALVVAEHERGKGVGRMLLESAEAWAAGRSAGSIRLRSNVLRKRAHAFFERAGYCAHKCSQVFDKALRDVGGD